MVTTRAITITYVPTADMAADGLTKPLPIPTHQKFIEQLGLTILGTDTLVRGV